MGVRHANSLICANGSILSGKCVHSEYGSNNDIMGRGYHSLHFNGMFKDMFNWVSDDHMLTITESGTYRLNRSQSQGIRYARIVDDTQKLKYYLEYRSPIGFDSTLSLVGQEGLFIDRVYDQGTSLDSPRAYQSLFVGKDNCPDCYQNNKYFIPGYILNDSMSGIHISILSQTDSYIEFEVEYKAPTCPDASISILGSDAFTTFTETAGTTITRSISITDWSNACGDIKYKISTTLDEGWNMRFYDAEYNELTQQVFTFSDKFVNKHSGIYLLNVEIDIPLAEGRGRGYPNLHIMQSDSRENTTIEFNVPYLSPLTIDVMSEEITPVDQPIIAFEGTMRHSNIEMQNDGSIVGQLPLQSIYLIASDWNILDKLGSTRVYFDNNMVYQSDTPEFYIQFESIQLLDEEVNLRIEYDLLDSSVHGVYFELSDLRSNTVRKLLLEPIKGNYFADILDAPSNLVARIGTTGSFN